MREWQARLTVNQVVYPVEVRVLPASLAQRCSVELLRDRKVTGSSPVISLWEMWLSWQSVWQLTSQNAVFPLCLTGDGSLLVE